jgi:hypothetical protein
MTTPSPSPSSLPPDLQAQLYKEADARFAAQTAITWKLDPKSWIDQALIPIWQKIYAGVLRDYHAGVLHLSHREPVVVQSLGKASQATAAAAQHAGAAIAAPTIDATHAHGEAAKANISAAQDHALAAAKAQPPTPGLPDALRTARDQVAPLIVPWIESGASINAPADLAKATTVMVAPEHAEAANAQNAQPLAAPPGWLEQLRHERDQIAAQAAAAAQHAEAAKPAEPGDGNEPPKRLTPTAIAILGGMLATIGIIGARNASTTSVESTERIPERPERAERSRSSRSSRSSRF